jgi:hypothetical protein
MSCSIMRFVGLHTCTYMRSSQTSSPRLLAGTCPATSPQTEQPVNGQPLFLIDRSGHHNSLPDKTPIEQLGGSQRFCRSPKPSLSRDIVETCCVAFLGRKLIAFTCCRGAVVMMCLRKQHPGLEVGKRVKHSRLCTCL